MIHDLTPPVGKDGPSLEQVYNAWMATASVIVPPAGGTVEFGPVRPGLVETFELWQRQHGQVVVDPNEKAAP